MWGPGRSESTKGALSVAVPMSDHDDADDAHDGDVEPHEADEHESEYATERTTAPQSDYTTRDVVVGTVVALVGMAVVFGVPLALTL